MLPSFKTVAGAIGKKLMSWSTYEGASNSTARARIPGAAPRDSKDDLTQHTRRELMRRSRYRLKNSGFMKEVVTDMDIYSVGSGMRPQAQTADAEWNRQAEEIFNRAAFRIDITNRFSFAECQTLACRGIDSDGDYFVIKVRDRFGRPRLQLIEAHRCGDDGSGETVDGVKFDRFGAPIFYMIREGDGQTYRKIPANAVMHIFEPESVSAARAVPTMQHSLNDLQDEHELLSLEKRAVKDISSISRVLTTEDGEIEENTDFQVDVSGETETEEPTSPKLLQKIMGGIVAAVKPGEKIDTFESKRPSPTFTGFLVHLLRKACGGMLPYEFVADPSKVGGASVRLITGKAQRRIERRQQVLINRMLVQTWGWIIGDAIDRGELEPIKDWFKVRYVTPRKITVDAGRENKENRADVVAGLKTLDEHYKELGQDFEEQLEIRARNMAAIMATAEKYGVPVDMLYNPSGGSIDDTAPPSKKNEDD